MSQFSSPDNLLEQLRTHLPASLLDAVDHRLTELSKSNNKITELSGELNVARLKIQLLEEKLRLARIKRYGPTSEKLSSLQLSLLDLEPGVSSEEVEAEATRDPLEPIQKQNQQKRKDRKKHPGRGPLPENLPRIERTLVCTEDQLHCKQCGSETVVIGYDENKVLDVKPAEYFVLVTKREKRACRCCAEVGVMAAPMPERIIAKSLVSDRVVIDTLLNKYTAHVPLYRQSALVERDTGVLIRRTTMDGWMMRSGDLLELLKPAMRKEILRSHYLQADETRVAVQMHDKRGKNHTAWLWQYGSPGGSVVFDFQMNRAREGPKKFLAGYEGILQTDGYYAYDHDVGGKKMVHAACWSHARRYFFEVLQANRKDEAAARLVTRIDGLFAVDARARKQNFHHAERHQLRLKETEPLLKPLREDLQTVLSQSLPSSDLAKACKYTLALWDRLTKFLEYPELELTNNSAENSMRLVALGRRNWLHLGHEKAGPRVAAILSVIESCRRLGVSPRDYLAEVLPRLANLSSADDLSQLTPAAWAAKRSSQK